MCSSSDIPSVLFTFLRFDSLCIIYIYMQRQRHSRTTISSLHFLFLLSTAVICTPQLNHLQTFFASILNDVRVAPESFAKYVEEQVECKYDGKYFDQMIETEEGVGCMRELSRYLHNMPTLFPLQLNPFLSLAAEQHSAYMAQSGALSHYMEGRGVASRLQENGEVKGNIVHVVFRTQKKVGSLITVLAFLLCDEGVKERGNREALLSSEMREVGVGASENENDFYLTLILAEEYVANKSYQSTVNQYKAEEKEYEIMKGDAEKMKGME